MKIWQSVEILRVYANFVFKRYMLWDISRLSTASVKSPTRRWC